MSRRRCCFVTGFSSELKPGPSCHIIMVCIVFEGPWAPQPISVIHMEHDDAVGAQHDSLLLLLFFIIYCSVFLRWGQNKLLLYICCTLCDELKVYTVHYKPTFWIYFLFIELHKKKNSSVVYKKESPVLTQWLWSTMLFQEWQVNGSCLFGPDVFIVIGLSMFNGKAE